MEFKKKSESWLMKFFDWLPFTPAGFMSRFWTTIGTTIYVPGYAEVHMGDLEWRFPSAITHEKVHIQQWQRFTGPLFVLMYVGPAPFLFCLAWAHIAILWCAIATLPLSCGLAVGRAYLEIEAYAATGSRPDFVADTLWDDYFFTLPKPWVRKWLQSYYSH